VITRNAAALARLSCVGVVFLSDAGDWLCFSGRGR
jgi:hypothetical protein